MARGRKPKAATASQNDNTVASRLRSRTAPTNGEDESTPPAGTIQQDKTVSRDPQPESIERDSTRKQIQMTCSNIEKLIKERGSRRACLGLLNKLDDMLATVERLNLLVKDPSDADEFSKQAQIQIDLFSLIESKKEDVEAYVTLRADDESSVGSCMQSIKSVPLATRPSAPDRNEEIQSEKLLAEAQKRAAVAQQEAARLQKRLEEVNKKADLANKEASKLSDAAIRRGSAPTIISSPFHGWGDGAINDWRHRSTHEPTKEDGEEEAPDDWIDRFCNGLEEANWPLGQTQLITDWTSKAVYHTLKLLDLPARLPTRRSYRGGRLAGLRQRFRLDSCCGDWTSVSPPLFSKDKRINHGHGSSHQPSLPQLGLLNARSGKNGYDGSSLSISKDSCNATFDRMI
ncbi:hypothetical protein DAPPUDRAFT_118625 [Daphnia pulex]|uniref:Uncharacterized protein n=1 Tax=Daphnia pulex TaxID=6669 RepID=E9HW79_DAPPU|nr:hypothetical protein DAPPUDRAFT_118625 [Daphnia pulex]|eukprot:EFX64006.1 hypothetical protein DAPPUDRAFT_118625 [Daphnia pulex]